MKGVVCGTVGAVAAVVIAAPSTCIGTEPFTINNVGSEFPGHRRARLRCFDITLPRGH